MAVKTPIVITNGQMELLQSGDTISGASSSDPSYSPGSFTVLTETAKIMANHLKLTTTQRATIEGTARLSIIN